MNREQEMELYLEKRKEKIFLKFLFFFAFPISFLISFYFLIEDSRLKVMEKNESSFEEVIFLKNDERLYYNGEKIKNKEESPYLKVF